MANPQRRPFEGVDLVEAGRRGGKASGESRRLRPLTLLEAKVLESNNGAAAVKLLELKRRELADLLDERRRADETVCQLLDEADAERETIAELRAQVADLRDQRRQVEAAVAELEQRAHELRRVVETGVGLVDLLRVAHVRELLEPALDELELFEKVDD